MLDFQLPLLDQLPVEVRLAFFRSCENATLAALARAYSSPSNPVHIEIEEVLYRRDLADGWSHALVHAIETSRVDMGIGSSILTKLQRFGTFLINEKSAFTTRLNTPIRLQRIGSDLEERPILLAARRGHVNIFHMMVCAGAELLEETGPSSFSPVRTWVVPGGAFERPSHLDWLEPKAGCTVLGYAFGRSLSTLAEDGPFLLAEVLYLAAYMSWASDLEVMHLYSPAIQEVTSPSEASRHSIRLGPRRQAEYDFGYILSRPHFDNSNDSGPSSPSLLASIAWWGDEHGFLPALLDRYRATLDSGHLDGQGFMAPLHAAIDSVGRNEFDLIMGVSDIDLNVETKDGQQYPLSMAIAGPSWWTGQDDQQFRRGSLTCLEMLLHRGANPDKVTGITTPLLAAIRHSADDARRQNLQVMKFSCEVVRQLLIHGADPCASVPPGLSVFEVVLGQWQAAPGERTAEEHALVTDHLGRILRLFAALSPDTVTKPLTQQGYSALCYAVVRRRYQLIKLLIEVGARLVPDTDAMRVMAVVKATPEMWYWLRGSDIAACEAATAGEQD